MTFCLRGSLCISEIIIILKYRIGGRGRGMTDQPMDAQRLAHAGAADGLLVLLGNPDLLDQSLLALFCSQRCPGNVILRPIGPG